MDPSLNARTFERLVERRAYPTIGDLDCVCHGRASLQYEAIVLQCCSRGTHLTGTASSQRLASSMSIRQCACRVTAHSRVDIEVCRL
jgi:hypothetical protein